MSNLAENDAANLPKIANNKVAPAPQMAQVAVVIPLSHKLKVKSTSLAHVLMLDPESGIFPEYFFVPKHFVIDNKQSHLHREYNLNIFERIFLCIERPNSCVLAGIISAILTLTIFLGVIIYVLSNDPMYQYQPDQCEHHAMICDHTENCPGRHVCAYHTTAWCEEAESIILYIFTAEYLIRFLLCPFMPTRFLGLLGEDEEIEAVHIYGKTHSDKDEEFPMWKKVVLYLIQYKCLIDVATIIPFYAFLGQGEGGQGFNFIRVLRLSRVLHVFKLTKDNEILHLLERTLKVSIPALGLVTFVGLLMMVLLGSIVFFVEQGVLTVTPEYPNGAFLRPNIEHNGMEVSPFTSIQVSLYWAISTMTHTGYGDVYPTSQGGRIVACITMLIGVVVCGLPVGVLGGNFSHEYEVYHSKYREHVGLGGHTSPPAMMATHSVITPEGKMPGLNGVELADSKDDSAAEGKEKSLSLYAAEGSAGHSHNVEALLKSLEHLQSQQAASMHQLMVKLEEVSMQHKQTDDAIRSALFALKSPH